MSFEKQNITMTMFRLAEKLPEDVLELFNEKTAGKLDNVGNEEQVGWTSGRGLLETEINEETCIVGGHILLNLRFAEKKIPASFMKELCKKEELNKMEHWGVDRISNKDKKEIREGIKEKYLNRFPPCVSGFEIAIDRASSMLYLGTCSNAKVNYFIQLFESVTGVEPIKVNNEELAFQYYQDANKSNALDFAFSFPNVNFAGVTNDDPKSMGRDFLTWLWWLSENREENKTDFELCLDGSMKLAFMFGGQGATETTVNMGLPQKSSEVKSALMGGKKLCKTKLIFAKDLKQWGFTFNADTFGFYSLSLPDGEEMERHSKFEERINNINEFNKIIKLFYFEFCKFVLSDDYADKEKMLQTWTAERESY
ncbi:MAG: hypothetical protein DRH97_00440 [Chloroflexi bacterium]|nr:MAG: hypothetical protein DRH97_00440 [Chloroflexota bacterium]